jgi:hypothetical protein
MIREHIGIQPEPDFRWRGGDVSRLEALTDGIFGFAITLLVVALEVPHTFDELLVAMRGFPAFAISFGVLAGVWYKHVIFFRRYGLQTRTIVRLNWVLIFVVLFYVYPLKFLFTLAAGLSGGATADGHMGATIRDAQVPALMIIYGLGYAAVSFVMALLYRHAYGKRRELALDPVEVVLTRQGLAENAWLGVIGLLSAVVAAVLPGSRAGNAGWVYLSIVPCMFVMGKMYEKRVAALLAQGAKPAADA